MNEEAVEIETAVHLHWTSRLKLFPSSRRIEHEDHKSAGSYEQIGNTLIVKWDQYPAECFVKVGARFIHSSILEGASSNAFASLQDLGDLAAARLCDAYVRLRAVTVLVPGHDYEVVLRLQTSDVACFRQSFFSCDYQSPHLPASADHILDLGANIGIASVFYGLKYPEARILAVEPDPSNYEMLKQNVSRLGARILTRRLAVWSEDGVVELMSTDEQGTSLLPWAIRTVKPKRDSAERVNCLSLPSLLSEFGVDEVDILKVDIEGAELELFSANASAWLPRIKMLIVETHERFRPGSDAAVRHAVGGLFEELSSEGENLIFRRK